MAWERRGSNNYYYRKKRIGRRVVSEYAGNGAIAQDIASMDLAVRKERNEKNRYIRQQREEFGLFDDQVIQISLLVDQMVRVFLIISGFHKHKGQWRRQRNVNM